MKLTVIASEAKQSRFENKIASSLMLLAMTFLGTSAQAKEVDLLPSTLESVRHLPIQDRGRVKPLDSFARETIYFLMGWERFEGQDPMVSVLSISAFPSEWTQKRMLSVPYRPLREALGLDPHITHISLDELMDTRKLMQMLPGLVEKQSQGEKLSMLENETSDLYQRFLALNLLMKQELYGVVPVEASWSQFMTALALGQEQAIQDAFQELKTNLAALPPELQSVPWRLSLEVFYNRIHPFRIAAVLYGLAFLGLSIGLIRAGSVTWVGWIALGIGFFMHGLGISLRVILGGRPPVSNFFETMLWLPFVAVLIALIFERVYRVRHFALSAAILAAISLTLADHVPLDPSIAPVVAVLRSNLWLTIHVLTIVASYGALALATVLAHLYGVAALTGKDSQLLERMGLSLYRAIQVGVVLLAAGVMLGGVWANASWGRYWGWDPKETWALITLLWFLALLHGRFAGWLKDLKLAVGTIAGFFLLLMTYYGVSFYLVGLHSYAGANAKPIPGLLIAYVLAEVTFLSFLGWKAFSHSQLPR